jgi:hypothetical protein
MNKILKSRVRLIRALQKGLELPELSRQEVLNLEYIIKCIRKDECAHFLSFSHDDPGKISYADKSSHQVNPNKRVRTSLGRYIRRKLGLTETMLSQTALTEITHTVFGKLHVENMDMESIQILTGDAITQAYKDGVGSASCMTGSDAEYVEMFARNPDRVSLVVFPTGNSYGCGFARALLWKTDEGVYLLDRIYPNDGSHVTAMHQWALQKGYVYRISTSAQDNCYPTKLSDGKVHKVTVTPARFSSGQHNIPYLDTFHWGNRVWDTEENKAKGPIDDINTNRECVADCKYLLTTGGDEDQTFLFASCHGDLVFTSDYERKRRDREYFASHTDRLSSEIYNLENRDIGNGSDPLGNCEVCGDSVYRDDGSECLESDECYVCSECIGSISVCDCCHERTLRELIYDEPSGEYLCSSCDEDLQQVRRREHILNAVYGETRNGREHPVVLIQEEELCRIGSSRAIFWRSCFCALCAARIHSGSYARIVATGIGGSGEDEYKICQTCYDRLRYTAPIYGTPVHN